MWKIIKKLDRLHLFLGLILVALVTMGAAIPSHITRLDSLVVTDDPSTTTSVTVGENDVYIEGTLEVDGAVRFDSTVALGSGAVAYTWPAADAAGVLTSDGAGALSWGTGAATAYDDIADPDADSTIVFGNDEINVWTFADINEDMFNIQGIGTFGDVSVVRIEQKTGDATDGTVLEVIAADANVDPLVISASGKANALVVGQNTGVVTIAGVAEATSALVITAGDILITDGDLHVDAGDALFDEDVTITGDLIGGTGLIDYTHFDVSAAGAITNVGAITSDADITTTANLIAVDGTFSGDVAVTGTFQQDALSAASAATTITLDGTGAGGVSIGTVAGTGTITLGGGGFATLVNLPNTVDLTLAGGDFAVTDTANADMVTFTNNTATTADLLSLASSATRTSNYIIAITDAATTASTIGITANTQTSGKGISYTNTGLGLTGDAIYLAVTDDAGFTGSYLNCYDGGASDFTIKRYGATVIGGLANTDMFTITTGKVKISDGLIDVDTNEDHSTSFTRDFAGAGTAACVVIDDTHTSSTKPALEINQDGIGASEGIKIVHDGDGAAIDISCGVARTVASLIDITTTNSLATNALFIDGAWTGASTVGAIEINTTGNIASGGSMVRLDYDTGTPAGTGFAIDIDDDSVDGGTFYAMLINSANNEGLHVEAGISLFAELTTFTGGIDVDAGVDIDFATNVTLAIDAAANDYAAASGILTIYDDSTGQTNASYLIRGAREADADAQDHFLLFEDNSTGAAANGDDMFYVNSGGVVYAASTVTATGGLSAGNASDSFLHIDTVEISNAEIKLLRANKKSLVATPGADKFVEVLSVVLILDKGTEVLTETTDNLVVQYATSGDDITAAIEMTGFIDQAADTIMAVNNSNPLAANAATDMVNNAVELFNTGDGEIAGNVTADATMTVKITYRIHTAGL